ncbi:MAG: hypothetical protein GXZ13_06565 [Synergistaceae bacterium]|nr:hypothetical protein [Synergistaceae bacterium]
MTEVKKRDNGEISHEYLGNGEVDPKQELEDLKNEIRALKEHIEGNAVKKLDFDKLKEKLGSGSDYVLNAIRPIIEKYENPSRQMAEKVETKVAENPFLSLVVAFGAGIVIGSLLNFCGKHISND